MPIGFGCPSCKNRISVPRRLAGTQVVCSKCKKEIPVPRVPGTESGDDLAQTFGSGIIAPAPLDTESDTKHAVPAVLEAEPEVSGSSPTVAVKGSTKVAPPPEVEKAKKDPRRNLGRFIVLSELGRGGMGIVYRAWDVHMTRIVALKTLLSSKDVDEETIARFYREAHAVAKLRHTSIVGIHDVGELKGVHYLAMDFVDGKTLAERLVDKEGVSSRPKGKALSLKQAVTIMRDVARALHYAHEQGVIHRDMKPQNIMIDKQNRPFVMDFGLARVDDQKTKLTQTGMAMGTPAFMSPEQAGAEGRPLDARTDVYSMGATLYNILTGRPPFEGETPYKILSALIAKEPEPPSSHNSEVSGDLENVCLKCLEKDPKKRYQTAAALADDLDRYLQGKPTATRFRKTNSTTRERRAEVLAEGPKGDPKWLQKTLAVAIVAGAIVFAAVLAHNSSSESPPKETSQEEPPKTTDSPVNTATDAPRPDTQRPPPPRPKTDTPPDVPSPRRSEAIDHVENAKSLAMGRKLQEALAEASKAIELDPKLAVAWANRGAMKAALGDTEGGISDLTRAIELDGRIPEVWSLRARARLKKKDRDGAFADAMRAIALDPRLTSALVCRARALLMKGDAEGALKDASDAIDVDPREMDAWVARTEARIAKRDYDGAFTDAGRVIEMDARLGNGWALRAWARTLKGDDPGSVIEDAHKAIELDPRIAVAWAAQGAARMTTGDNASAISDLGRAVELDPALAFAWARRGKLKLDKGDAPGGIADLDKAIELDPRNAAAWANRALGRFMQEDLDGATADVDHAIDVDPGFAYAYISRGMIRMKGQDLKGAIADLSKAIELEPRNAEAWCKRSAAKYYNHDPKGAEADATRSLALDSKVPAAWLARGLAREWTGDKPGSAADLEKFLEMAPDAPQAGDVRIRLKNIKGGK